jgi:hypothetical protein
MKDKTRPENALLRNTVSSPKVASRLTYDLCADIFLIEKVLFFLSSGILCGTVYYVL